MKSAAPFVLLLLLAGCPANSCGEAPKAPSPRDAAAALVKQKDIPGAIRILEEVRETSGPEPQLVLDLSDLYQAQKDPSRAIVRLRQGIEVHPESTLLFLPLASLYLQVNELKLARECLEKARAAGVDDAQVSLSMGSCLARTSDFEGALREFERAGKAGAEEKAVAYNQALVMTETKDWVKARELLEKALSKDPNWAPAKRELARVMLAQATLDADRTKVVDKKSVDAAMDLLMSVNDVLKDDWRIAEAMGDGWLLEGDLDAALAAYTDALRFGQNPKSVEDRYRVAKQKQNEALQKSGKAPGKGGAAPTNPPK